MQSISSPLRSAKAVDYYAEAETANYYANKDQQNGYWSGKAAEKLGLPNEVTRKEFLNLLNGFSPDGSQKLVQNAGQAKRQAALDITWSGPKPLAVLWAMSDGGTRRKIEAIQKAATAIGTGFIQAHCGFTRRGKAGRSLERADLLFANFPHYTSRSNDPALHTHTVLVNLGIRADGTTGTLWSEEIFRQKMAGGQIYRETLAELLKTELGLIIKQEKIGFSIQGVPNDLCEVFSKRRAEIAKAMAEKGFSTAVAAKIAALDTRPKKKNVPLRDLTPYWIRVGEQYGFGPVQAEALIAEGRRRIETIHAREGRSLTQKARVEQHSESHSEKHEQGGQTLQPNSEIRGRKDAYLHTPQKSEEQISNKPSKHTPQIPKHALPKKGKSPFRIKRELVFPNAPEWNPLKKLAVSHLSPAEAKQFKRWGKIKWGKHLGIVQIRIQEKYLFPNASHLSPLHKVTIPSLRILSPSQLRKMRAKKAKIERMQQRLTH